jgi:hypothetical protein
MGEKSKPWRNSPQLLLRPDCTGKIGQKEARAPRTSRSKRRILRLPQVVIMSDGLRASGQRCVKSHDGTIHASRRILCFVQALLPSSNAMPCAVHFSLIYDSFAKTEKQGPASGLEWGLHRAGGSLSNGQKFE